MKLHVFTRGTVVTCFLLITVMPGTAAEPDGTVRRNPFAITEKMTLPQTEPEPVKQEPELPKPSQRFARQKLPSLPDMKMLGRMKNAKGETVALLEVGNKHVYVVHEGDNIGLYEIGVDAVVQIISIGRREIVIESGSLSEQLVVR